MGIKHYQEKNARAMEKELAQSDIPVKRKIQKTIRKYHISESLIPIYKVYDNFFFLPYNGEIKKVIWPVGGLFFAKIPKLSDGKSYNGP